MNKKRSLARHCELLERAAKRRQHVIYRDIALATKYNTLVLFIRFCRRASIFFHLSQSAAANSALVRSLSHINPDKIAGYSRCHAFILALSPEQWADITAPHRVDYKGAVLQ